MEHIVGSTTLPLAAIQDKPLYYIGNAIKTYCNTVLGDAWKAVNHNDGYVIKNVHYSPSTYQPAFIHSQLPAIYLFRKKTERKPFFIGYDILKSTIVCEYVMPMTADRDVDARYAIFNHVFNAINSLIMRGFRHNDVDLLSDYAIEHIDLIFEETQLKALRYQTTNGFYQSITTMELTEIVNPATEDYEDLDVANIIINLGGEDGYSDGYRLDSFSTIEGL